MYDHKLLRAVSGSIVAGSILASLLLCCGCPSEKPVAEAAPFPPPARLMVITPHNPMIRDLFDMGFSDWHHARFGEYVETQWLTMGTVECVRYIEETRAALPDGGARRCPDVMFGGGISEHRILKDEGLARAIDIQEALQGIPESVLGLPTRDPERHWYATALSGFGILYHKKACAERGIPAPATWADLARPEYYGWVSIADPNRSGSNRQCLTLVLQKHGWEEGWPVILRTAANCRALLLDSSDVSTNVRVGMALAGLSVSFNAQHDIDVLGQDQLGYADPPGASAITPDLVTVLADASSPELGERFVRFCLSDEGQLLWGLKAEARGGYNDTLYRYPVNPKIYESYGDKLSVDENPFTMDAEFKLDLDTALQQTQLIGPLLRAACGENHILLQKCWRKIIDAGLPPEALHELNELPFDASTASELGARCAAGGPEAEQLVSDWSAWFRAKYEKILSTPG